MYTYIIINAFSLYFLMWPMHGDSASVSLCDPFITWLFFNQECFGVMAGSSPQALVLICYADDINMFFQVSKQAQNVVLPAACCCGGLGVAVTQSLTKGLWKCLRNLLNRSIAFLKFSLCALPNETFRRWIMHEEWWIFSPWLVLDETE